MVQPNVNKTQNKYHYQRVIVWTNLTINQHEDSVYYTNLENRWMDEGVLCHFDLKERKKSKKMGDRFLSYLCTKYSTLHKLECTRKTEVFRLLHVKCKFYAMLKSIKKLGWDGYKSCYSNRGLLFSVFTVKMFTLQSKCSLLQSGAD